MHSAEQQHYEANLLHQTFRAVVQWSIPLVCAVNLIHCAVMLIHDCEWWRWSLAACLIEAPLFLITTQKRPYSLFLLGTLLLVLFITAHVSLLTHSLGTAPGFHLLLLALLPVLMVGGHISLRGKILGGLLLTILLLVLDGSSPHTTIRLDPEAVEHLHRFNLGVLAASVSVIGLIYFALVARTQRHLARLAGSDPMTGLLNRRRMSERAAQSIALGRRKGFPVAVILGDIDHFKRINDQHGHEVGDDAIRHVSQQMQNAVRDSDTVARWGGEEFLVLLPHTDLDTAYQAAERVRQHLQDNPLRLADGSSLPLSMTLGVASLQPEEDLAAVVHRADMALYAGKQAGRNRAMRA